MTLERSEVEDGIQVVSPPHTHTHLVALGELFNLPAHLSSGGK